jgi:hypothetical protein
MTKKESSKQSKSGGASETGDKRLRESVDPTRQMELTDEEADRMVTEAMDCELPEPEPFVKMLLYLFDLHEQGRGPELSDSLHRLMVAAYNNSIVHSGNFYEYLDSVRKGRNLAKRARGWIANG